MNAIVCDAGFEVGGGCRMRRAYRKPVLMRLGLLRRITCQTLVSIIRV